MTIPNTSASVADGNTHSTHALSRLWHSRALRLAILAFIIYNLNLRELTTWDTIATRYVPLSILKHLDLNLDEFPHLHTYPDAATRGDRGYAEEVPYYVQLKNGHYLSTYPVMPGILSAPIYALPVWALSAAHVNVADLRWVTILGKLSASFAVAASVALIYLSLLHLTTPRRALLVTLIYAFATSSWSVSSQGLWQHAWSQPMLALALYLLLRCRKVTETLNPEPRTLNPSVSLFFSGGALALSVACRPPNLIFAAILSIYVLHAFRLRGSVFFILPALIGGWLLSYHLSAYGTLAGGYAQEMTHVEHSASAGITFTYPRPTVLLGLLFSPSRGILTHSPILLFAFAGASLALIHRADRLLIYTAIATLTTLVFYSSWGVWWAGNSFSYRFLVDLLPGLCLLLPLTLDATFSRASLRAIFIATLAISLFVQVIGAFFWSPSVWYGSLKNGTKLGVQNAHERLWDWRDPEAIRCLLNGPQRPPILPSR